MSHSATLTEPARHLPIRSHHQVVIVGGGIAGVAAALAAARHGARTCLIEKQFGLGGLATLGNVIVFLPICDGNGRQVIGGIAEELLLRSVRDLRRKQEGLGMEPVPDCWTREASQEERSKKRYLCRFNPFTLQMELEVLLAEAGVELWYDTRLCNVVCHDGRVTHLVVENKSGRSALSCDAVVDASGDADVCALAGEATETLDSNVLASWHYVLRDGQVGLRAKSHRFSPLAQREGSEGPFFDGTDARQVTDHLLQARAWVRDMIAAERAAAPEAEIAPFALGSIPAFRMTRRLVGAYSLTEADDHGWFDDTVGLTGDWRKRGPIWPIPYRSLVGCRCRNLLVAGRCISADTTVWDATRAIPTCALTGEIAGTAAALGGTAAADLPVETLRDRLRERGNLVDRID